MKNIEKKDIKQKSLKKNVGLNMTKSIMSLIFPLITFPYSSRILGPIYIGKVNFAHSVVSYFSLLAALGINVYAIREAAKLRDNKIKLSIFIKEIFTINLISTVIAYILFGVAIFLIPTLNEYKKLLCICSASIIFTTIGMDYLYTALEEFEYITIRSIIFQFISIALLFIFIHTSEDYFKYAAISVIASVGSNLLNFFHARHFIDFRIKQKLNLGKHLKPIFILFAMNAAINIYTVLDSTMLGFMKGDEAVGIYTAATKINRIITVMITSISSILLPRLSYYAKNKNNEDFLRISNKAFNFIMLLSIPSALGLFVLSEPITLLFSGKEYSSAIQVMKIMNPVIIFISLSNLMGNQILMSVGKENKVLFSVVVGSITNFTMNSIFIPIFGVFGAAIGTLCAEFLVTLIQFIETRRYFLHKDILDNTIKVVLSSVIMSILVYKVSTFFNNNLIKIIIGIPVGIFIYTVLLFIFKNTFFIKFVKETIVQINNKVKKL